MQSWESINLQLPEKIKKYYEYAFRYRPNIMSGLYAEKRSEIRNKF